MPDRFDLPVRPLCKTPSTKDAACDARPAGPYPEESAAMAQPTPVKAENAQPDTDGSQDAGSPPRSDVLVFLRHDEKDLNALLHAQRVAKAFGGRVSLLRVMAPPNDNAAPVDPVDWDIKKKAALKCLERLAEALDPKEKTVGSLILEGQCIEQIAAFTETRKGDIAAALRPRGTGRWRLNETLSGVLHSHSAAILMIPLGTPQKAGRGVRRILVPMDGSARAETALPRAVALAKAEKANLVFCYVAPEAGLAEVGIMDSKDIALQEQVVKRNARAGEAYLKRITNSLAHHDLNISTLIIAGGDARRALLRAASQKEADFLVMATHGQSGHSDVPTGDVASFILDRAEIPVLMVRHRGSAASHHTTEPVVSTGVRQPTGTDP